jgi:nucleotide-binding universal stress UspA family protein
MFQNVLVGVDGREGGRDAVTLAGRLLADGGRLTLGHVYHRSPQTWLAASPPLEADERERIRRLLEVAASEAEAAAEPRWHGASTVGRGLHELAEESGADLLVVGSSRRSLVGRVFVGDDARASLNGAPCAIAVAPADYALEPGQISEIGVAYDESPESEHALRVARSLAMAHHAKLSVFEAISFPAVALGAGVMVKDVLAAAVDEAQRRLAALGGVEPHAAYGDAAEELALYSAALDLLVIGSRGYGPLGRLVHGSTANRLARTARCPLLVLTRGARKAGDRLHGTTDATQPPPAET